MAKIKLYNEIYSINRISVNFEKAAGKITAAVGDIYLSKDGEDKAMHLGMYRRNAGHDNPVVFCDNFDSKTKKGVKLFCHEGTKTLMDLINRQIHRKAEILRQQRNAVKEEKKKEQVVVAYTDGACSGNPGIGGWGAIICAAEKEFELSGSEAQTTNNRMEVMAIVSVLEQCKDANAVEIYSDSTYAIKCASREWKRNKNQDLWERYDKASAGKKITFHYVKGHNGNVMNERADALAVAARKEQEVK